MTRPCSCSVSARANQATSCPWPAIDKSFTSLPCRETPSKQRQPCRKCSPKLEVRDDRNAQILRSITTGDGQILAPLRTGPFAAARYREYQNRTLAPTRQHPNLEARMGFEPTYNGFANHCLTTWLPRLIAPSSPSKDPRERRKRPRT